MAVIDLSKSGVRTITTVGSGRILRTWTATRTQAAALPGRPGIAHTIWLFRGYHRLGRRMVRTYRDDYPKLIRTAQIELRRAEGTVAEGRAQSVRDGRRAQYKKHRQVWAAKAGVVAGAATGGAAYGMVTGGPLFDVALALGIGGLGMWHGRPAAAGSQYDNGTIVIPADDDAPYPISDAHDRSGAAECVRRALVSEGINLASVEAGRRYPWGWEVTVRLAKGKPADLIAKCPDLETPLDLPQDGLLAQPDRTARARVVLRLVQSDPFVGLPAVPERKPNSLRLKDKALVSRRMDGTDFQLSLLGLHFIVIAGSGGGKSVTMRTIGDVLTACEDVVVVDIDPGGNGLEPLAEAVGVRVVGADQMHRIEAVLEKLLKIAKARATLLGKLGMGDNWIPSRRFPAIVGLIDEYPQLSPRAKELVVAILRVGRKARVQIGLAAQEATKDSIGAAIADSIALRIVGPSRHQDVVQVFGAGAIGNGWRPDRLHPAQGADPADAGKAYIMGGGSVDPMIYKFLAMTPQEGKDRAAERRAAGRPVIDPESLAAAGVTFDDLEDVRAGRNVPLVIGLARAAFTEKEDPARLTTAEIYDYAARTEPAAWAPDPADGEDEDKARKRAADRYLRELRESAAQLDSTVDMTTRQWSGGRGYHLETIQRLTGEIAPEGF